MVARRISCAPAEGADCSRRKAPIGPGIGEVSAESHPRTLKGVMARAEGERSPVSGAVCVGPRTDRPSAAPLELSSESEGVMARGGDPAAADWEATVSLGADADEVGPSSSRSRCGGTVGGRWDRGTERRDATVLLSSLRRSEEAMENGPTVAASSWERSSSLGTRTRLARFAIRNSSSNAARSLRDRSSSFVRFTAKISNSFRLHTKCTSENPPDPKWRSTKKSCASVTRAWPWP